jgi:hypothetical protein
MIFDIDSVRDFFRCDYIPKRLNIKHIKDQKFLN